jgi:uncharacterized membrane protein YidH (DUF202 family)
MAAVKLPDYDRQQLAAARTLLTYVRISLARLAFELTMLRFHPGRALRYGALATSGTVLVVG